MRKTLTITLFVLLLTLIPISAARADVAPPQYPPGASIQSNEPATQVQMVAEAVTLDVRDDPRESEMFGGLATDAMSAHVNATFQMRNQGTAEESFAVWFPLGAPSGFGEVAQVENFAATVDGTPAAITVVDLPGEFDEQVPWATWPVTFPPGQDVKITVDYDIRPTGYSPFGTFYYILETGAGWNGPIGQGTITVRLPFPINQTNVILPDHFTVSGSEAVWTFTELEPTSANDVRITVMEPPVSARIAAAREAAAADPDSVPTLLELGRALDAGIVYKYDSPNEPNMPALLDEAAAAYEHALELDPNNPEIYAAYLDLKVNTSWFLDETPPEITSLIERALTVAPADPDLLEFRDLYHPDFTPPAAPTLFPTPNITPRPSATPGAVEPTEIAQAATPTPPAAVSTLIPTPASNAAPPDRVCPPIGLILLPVAFVFARRKRR